MLNTGERSVEIKPVFLFNSSTSVRSIPHFAFPLRIPGKISVLFIFAERILMTDVSVCTKVNQNPKLFIYPVTSLAAILFQLFEFFIFSLVTFTLKYWYSLPRVPHNGSYFA